MTTSAAAVAQETPPAIATTETPTVEAKQAEQIKTLFDAKTEPAPKVETKEAVTEAKPEAKTETAITETKVDEKPVIPEKYDFKLPEGSQLKPDVLEKIASIAKERGFTNEQAQALVDPKLQSVISEVVTAKLQEETKHKAMTEWVNEAKNDKEIGGDAFGKSIESAKRVVQRFGTDQFRKALNETGLGNHPELVRVFARIGKAMEPHELIKPGSQPGITKKSMEETLYGDGK